MERWIEDDGLIDKQMKTPVSTVRSGVSIWENNRGCLNNQVLFIVFWHALIEKCSQEVFSYLEPSGRIYFEDDDFDLFLPVARFF